MFLLSFYVVLFIGLALLEVILLEMEHFGRATVLVIGTALAIQFGHILPLWSWVTAHPALLLQYAIIYLLVGVLWSFFRWWRLFVHWRDEYAKIRSNYLKDKGLPPNTIPTDDQVREMSRRQGYYGDDKVNPPTFERNRGRLMAWMVFCIFSMIGWLFNSPIRRLYEFVVDMFKGTYQRIGDYMLRQFPELRRK